MQINPYQTTYQPTMTNFNPGYGAYQYNPMQNVQPQRIVQQEQTQPQQAVAQQPGMIGRMVAKMEDIVPNDVPMNGMPAFFPKQDLTEIYVKLWNNDGTLSTFVFKPSQNGEGINPQGSNKKLEIGLSEDATKAFMGRFDDLSNRLDVIEKSIKPKGRTSTAKKDGDGE